MGKTTPHRDTFLLADERFIDLDCHTSAAHRWQIAALHGLADTMGHEPRRLVLHTQDAHKLVAADAFLAAAHQIDSLQPVVQRNMARLKHGANLDGELALAGAAAI
jgi:hypothetical protein